MAAPTTSETFSVGRMRPPIVVSNIVQVRPTPDGFGYWLVGSDGSVYAFGDAPYFGSLPGLGVHVSDVVGLIPFSSETDTSS